MTTFLVLVLAEAQGIEVLSLSPWMYMILLATAVVSLITGLIALLREMRSLKEVVNGRLDELLKTSRKEAHRQGVEEGILAERARGDSSRVEELVKTKEEVAILGGILKTAAALDETGKIKEAAAASGILKKGKGPNPPSIQIGPDDALGN